MSLDHSVFTFLISFFMKWERQSFKDCVVSETLTHEQTALPLPSAVLRVTFSNGAGDRGADVPAQGSLIYCPGCRVGDRQGSIYTPKQKAKDMWQKRGKKVTKEIIHSCITNIMEVLSLKKRENRCAKFVFPCWSLVCFSHPQFLTFPSGSYSFCLSPYSLYVLS